MSFLVFCKITFSSALHRERRVLLVPKAGMVQMVLLENLEMMVPLETQDLKDQLVIKAMMQISKIAVDVHHPVPPKAFKVVQVNKEILVYLADLADQVPLVNLVDAFLVIKESLVKMVNQVMMESMVSLVNQVTLVDLEMLLGLRSLLVQISSLT